MFYLFSLNLQQVLFRIDFETLLRGGSTLFNWLSLVNRYGFGKVTHGPVKPGALFQKTNLP